MKKTLSLLGVLAAAVLPHAPAANAPCIVIPPGEVPIPCQSKSTAAPSGRGRGFNSVTDPQVEGSQTGEVNGGPMVIGDNDPTVIHTGTMTCTIQVNQSTHAGADACSVSSASSSVVVVAAGTCTYASARGDNVYLCTQ